MRGSGAFRAAVSPGGVLAGPWVRDALWRQARTVPSLDLRFADNKSLTDAVTGQSLVTFTRASNATYIDSAGTLQTAVTNLCLQSQDFSTTWTNFNSTESVNTTAAPDGTVTADTLIPNNGATDGLIRQDFSGSTFTDNASISFSIFVKAAGLTNFNIQFYNKANTFHVTQTVNASTGALTGSGTLTTTSVTAVGDGWFRVGVTGMAAGSGANTPSLRFFVTSTGNGTAGIYIWGAQLEQSSTVGEYIPTTSATNSAPRFDHNPATGESLGLLVEEQRTNLVTYSEQLNDVIWGPVAGTVTANAETSPANTLTADKLIATNGGPQGQLAQGVTITSGATVTGSVYAKAGGFDRVELVLLASNNTTPYGRSTFNPNTGVITTAAFTSNGGTNASSAVQVLTNGWYRFSVTVTYPAVTSAGVRFAVFNSDSANGDGVKGVFLWGAQLEAGAFPTSYIPTTTAAATRSADVASITGANFSSWYNQTQGSTYWEGTPSATTETAYFGFQDSTTNNVIRISRQFNQARTIVNASAVTQADIYSGNFITLGSNNKIAVATAANNFGQSLNGGTVITSGSGSMPTVDRATIGAGAFINQINGTIKRLTYWPQRLPNSTLQAITQ